MIVYGTNGAHVRTTLLPGVNCPSCAAAETLQLSLFSRYVHIYWVPVLPYSKPVVAQCGHCQRAWEGKELPAEVQESARGFKKETRAPLWHWSGLALIAIFIAWAVVASSQDARANADYLAAPRPGDIYTVRSDEDQSIYSLLKVVSAKGNAVELVANKFEVNDNHPIGKLNSADKYSKESFSLTQFELQIMQNKGQITDVDRLEE
ncbi:hypothetical protein [Hymenobacter sp. B1770]|uniref:hypothetical protein n=1 Tax=Hymenobacter sp. B1770 TaxID=1718788 RepID=UPI003CE989CB